MNLYNRIWNWWHGVKYSGYQNVGYIEQADGEPILVNYEWSKPAWKRDDSPTRISEENVPKTLRFVRSSENPN